MKAQYVGPALDYSGYGEANRHDIGALLSAGIDLNLKCPSYVHDLADFGKLGAKMIELQNNEIPYYFKIVHTTPDQFKKYFEIDKYNIGRVIWETDKLPPDFAEASEVMNEIWVASDYGKKAAEKAGVTKPIYIIPEAIDTELDVEKIEPYKSDAKGFTFYSIFEWTERKNPRALLTAYWKTFGKDDKVSLVLKTYMTNFSMSKKREIEHEIGKIKAELNLPYYAPVYIYKELMDRHQIYRLHKTFDCFVSAHRGEGWGIPQMEAMLMGNPIVSTNLCGIHEYLEHGKDALLVDYSLTQIRNNTFNSQWYRNDQNWGEINSEHLQSTLRWVYDNKKAAKMIGTNARQTVINKFAFPVVGQLMRDRLQAIENERWSNE
jgi:glycosyltransferase involved in cell wall biosynthesis